MALFPLAGCYKSPAEKQASPPFFTPRERDFIQSAAEIIFPAKDLSPHKNPFHYVDFIENQLNLPYGFGDRTYLSPPFVYGKKPLGYQLPFTPRELYRNSLKSFFQWLDQNFKGKDFSALPPRTQIKILEDLEDGGIDLEDIPSSVFFRQLRSNVLEAAFADPFYGANDDMQGWKFLGFPGARAEFMAFINQNGAPYPYKPVAIPLSLDQMKSFWQRQEEESMADL